MKRTSSTAKPASWLQNGVLLALVAAFLVGSGCRQNPDADRSGRTDGRIEIVATTNMVADVVAILGSIDIVLGEVDR